MVGLLIEKGADIHANEDKAFCWTNAMVAKQLFSKILFALYFYISILKLFRK